MAEYVVSWRRYGIPASEREDLVQQTLFSTCKEFSKEGFALRQALGCFVRHVAHGRCVDWLRRIRKQREIEIPGAPPDPPDTRKSPETMILENEMDGLATMVLGRLPLACRQLIERNILEGLPYGVIAAMTGRSEGALRLQMYTCLRKAWRIRDEILIGGPRTPQPGKDPRREQR